MTPKALSGKGRKHGKGKGKSLLAHKLGRSIYQRLKENQVFDEAKFLSH